MCRRVAGSSLSEQHFQLVDGAWLAEHRDKIVIAPGIVRYSGICAWGFKGLIPSQWIRM